MSDLSYGELELFYRDRLVVEVFNKTHCSVLL